MGLVDVEVGMGKNPPRGPDFLVIGAQRAGTTWAHQILRRHPSLWLPPVKELHYFDKPTRTRTWFDPYERRRIQVSSFDPWYLRYLLGKRSDKWYARLFHRAQMRGLVAGEVTPDYAVLSADVFQRIKRMNPKIKIVLIMRDPIDRAWSSVNNAFRKGRADSLSTEGALKWARLQGPTARSNYANTISRLEVIFPPSQLHFCFFDDLRDRPESFARKLFSFLGVDTEVSKMDWPKAVNVAAAQKPMPPGFAREIANDYFLMVQELCSRFEGPPHNWRARYEKLLSRASDRQESPSSV
jgi:hypothetical protein